MTENYDEKTLDKVREALDDVGLTRHQAIDAINIMQNAGILFRERIAVESVARYTPEELEKIKAHEAREAAAERPDNSEATMATEPIEHRLRRAWINGFREGVEQSAWRAGAWDFR